MLVKLRARMAGPLGNFAPGKAVDLPEKLARELVESGQAEAFVPRIRGRQAMPAGRQVETATAEPEAEEAVEPAPVRRGRS